VSENDSLSKNLAAAVIITVSPTVFTCSKNFFGNKKALSSRPENRQLEPKC
jgi:hypothetical protein